MRNTQLKIGLFGIGLEAYWEQFEGLKDRLEGYIDFVGEKLSHPDIEIVNLGLIDTSEKAFAAGHRFKEKDIDLLFLYVTTYSLSAIVLPVVKRAKVPVVVLNLSPELAIDYKKFNALGDRTEMTGEWLAYCSACTMPEIANVFKRANIPFFQINGALKNDPHVWQEVNEWVEAANVADIMYHNRLGIIGSYYGGMLDIYSDLTLQCATFGGHMEIIEMDELSSIRSKVDERAVMSKKDSFMEIFEVQPDCSSSELIRAARTAVALDIIVDKYRLGSIAYYHKGTGNPINEDTVTSIILGSSILTARGTPVAGEYEIKNVQAMKILDSFKAGGSFTEYYAMDYIDDVILMGHDGSGHLTIAEGKIKVRPLNVYHGKNGFGLSVEMSVKNGPVTLLSVIETNEGTIMFLVAEAQSVSGPILEIGNTNSRYKFPIGARKFVESWNSHGPAHHCAIGVGHISSKIQKLGHLLNIKTIQVC
jgi:L-arabinose isomerase